MFNTSNIERCLFKNFTERNQTRPSIRFEVSTIRPRRAGDRRRCDRRHPANNGRVGWIPPRGRFVSFSPVRSGVERSSRSPALGGRLAGPSSTTCALPHTCPVVMHNLPSPPSFPPLPSRNLTPPTPPRVQCTLVVAVVSSLLFTPQR